MKNYRMKIAYDGTDFHGWQIQPNGISIQESIQQAIEVVTKQHVTVIGSGRTDAGVHALGQVAHFHSNLLLDPFKFRYSLNGLLPPEIRILEFEEVSTSFHAQHHADGKIYHYHLCLDLFQSPFRKRYSCHVKHKIDVDLLMEAAKLFLGTHDFTAFANNASEGVAAHDPVRTIFRVDVIPQEGGVRIEFEGDGFLYKMVRTMVGTLLEVARGKRPMEDIPAIFSSKDRRQAGSAAPPHGLFLVEVKYPH